MRTVALYGNSLGLSSIAASLEGRSELRVVPVEQLGGTQPDAALFDLAECRVDCALITMLKDQPRLLLIGVDLAENRVLVFYGRSSRMLTIEDLVEVFEAQGKKKEKQPRKPKLR